MSADRRPPLAVMVGVPVVMLLVGSGIGWFMRDDGGTTGGNGNAPVATVIGAALSTSLDSVAPQLPLPAAANPAVIDPASIIGLDTAEMIDVPAAAALDLPLAPGGTPLAVDPVTRKALQSIAPTTRPVGEPTFNDSLPEIAPPESTLPPIDSTTPVISGPVDVVPTFIDPCTASRDTCAGAPGVVRDAPTTDGPTLAPLQVSVPVAGAEGFAALCDSVEAGVVPDPFLTPSTRPTIAVFVNQPSTLALTGTWADGTELPKTTMITSSTHDTEWQRSWESDHVQLNIIACVTLPLDDVRAHAGGGVADLRADILAISATGRADATGQLTLDIPIDGNDAVFAERLTIADRGEQLLADGVLHPSVHVHYAFFDDAVVPLGSGLDRTTLHVYDEHALVEGADCSGWAVNQQGRDRTTSSSYTVVSEQRTIAGRVRNVTVVDGDVHLDPSLPGGWQGYFCVRLSATDDQTSEAVTLALRGTTVRSPRTATYAVSVLLADPEYPADRQLRASWTTTDGIVLCNSALLSNAPAADGSSHGATCDTIARLAPTGVVLGISAVDAAGAALPIFSVRVPVNTGYCNPDDPFGSVGDGCDHGFAQPYDVPLPAPTQDAGDVKSVRVVVQVNRVAAAGTMWQDPSHVWKVGTLTAFGY